MRATFIHSTLGTFVRPAKKRCEHCLDEKPVEEFDVFFEGAQQLKRYRSKCQKCMQLLSTRVCACGCGELLPKTTPKSKPYRVGHNPETARARGEERREYVRAWRHANPDRRLQHVLKHKFGLSLERYQELRRAQQDRCAICGTTEPGGNCKRWCVDHDHSTGVVRGLLCINCNSGIGALGDTAANVRRAVNYLDPPRLDGLSMGFLW